MDGYAHDTTVTLGTVTWWDAACPKRDAPLSDYPQWYAMNHLIKCNVLGRSFLKVDGPVWVARRDIDKGEELTYNYGIVPQEWKTAEHVKNGTSVFVLFEIREVFGPYMLYDVYRRGAPQRSQWQRAGGGSADYL
jgi:hypothetical protein